ncbi:hypothetical protein [Microbacterium atlanticum]|uniref:hypothetical protein n=1 Tax=Microbacterium atlanticum TaxID=2782168 RepID=UPI00188964C4|nr:hypothetical protein [Microbacterium atlanticum]
MSAPGQAAGTAPAYPFDARPLVEPVPRAAARAFAEELRRTGRLAGSGTSVVVVIVIGAIFAVVFGSVAITLVSAVASAIAAGGGGASVLFLIFPLVVFGVIAGGAVLLFLGGTRRAEERMYRLDRFARSNGMTYLPRLSAPPLPGMIFAIGGTRQASDLVRGDTPRFVEFANYRYTTGSGKNRQTHQWGYVAVKLDTPLPHIVLDATSNNSLFGSNLPLTFDRDQRLSLEGDFDRYFALSCPAGYERDALYLFTPDIMARFIDNAAALDVEIVDDWLFLYAKRDFSTLDPQTWAWLFSVVGALLDKLAQWARWRDERLAAERAATTDAATPGAAPLPGAGHAGHAASAVPFVAPLDALRPPPGVAPQGRRLQKGVPWKTIIVAGIVVAWWLLSNSGFFGLFSR